MTISRAKVAFLQMKNIWASPNLTINIKIRIFNTTVKPVLLHGAETWRTTVATLKKIQTLINTCLRKIHRTWWPETISNSELWAKLQPVEVEILQRRCRRIGHTLRKPTTVSHVSPYLESTGKEKARLPKKHLATRSRDWNKKGWVTPADNLRD